MAASPLSMVLKGGWPNLDCVRLCTKAVKWVEGRNTYAQRTRGRPLQGAVTLYIQLTS